MSRQGSAIEVKERAFQAELFADPVPELTTLRGFCVLASSSGGNCSALVHGEGKLKRITLIDAGLSPRRTRYFLAQVGLSIELVDDVLFTHFDTDHCYNGWGGKFPRHTRIHAHARHRSRARWFDLPADRTNFFEGDFELRGGLRVTTILQSHDEDGVIAFRFDAPTGGSLGYATDLGRAGQRLHDALRGVDTLAIESNYCPKMQLASTRPEYLKRRIMGGAGHLSNEQCRDAVREIAPKSRVVLLHLSRECNHPELAASYHANAPYGVVVSRPDQPTELFQL
ncbi:MAG TPA: MBL fold metallo-hydrolase [Phycisphaerales bacterium]|nr:MBL fold metallo-hydrolase [Phycisphaerales bacterium]